jgi:hypothetical protein
VIEALNLRNMPIATSNGCVGFYADNDIPLLKGLAYWGFCTELRAIAAGDGGVLREVTIRSVEDSPEAFGGRETL